MKVKEIPKGMPIQRFFSFTIIQQAKGKTKMVANKISSKRPKILIMSP